MRFKSGTEGAGGCAFSGAGAGAGLAGSTGVLIGDFLGGCLTSGALGLVTLFSGAGAGAGAAGLVGSGSGAF